MCCYTYLLLFQKNSTKKPTIFIFVRPQCILFLLSVSLPLCVLGFFVFFPSQSDNLLSYLTVEETLTYTAQLALQKHSDDAIKKKVDFESFSCPAHIV